MLLYQQFLGGGAGGGGDAEEVGAAGPGGDVEVGFEARGGGFKEEPPSEVVGFDAGEAEAGGHPDLVLGCTEV